MRASSYLATVNAALVRAASAALASGTPLVQMGEDIDKGSCYCGMTRNLPGMPINIGKCEISHASTGFGLMRNGANCVLYVKHLESLLLARDQLARAIQQQRARGAAAAGSFTVVWIARDQGRQGPRPQPASLDDVCPAIRADGFAPVARAEIGRIVASQLTRPGFRIIAFSQRLFGAPVLDLPLAWEAGDQCAFQFSTGGEATIACFSFSLDSGAELAARIAASGGSASLFSLHRVAPHRWERVAADAARTGRLILFDAGKDDFSGAHKLAAQVLSAAPGTRVEMHTREEEAVDAVSAEPYATSLEDLAPCH